MNPHLQNAFLGSLVADAVAMPVHWYYNISAMDRDYGAFTGYQAPKNPHPDSILWRSHYKARSPEGEILHDQAFFWGQRDIHYHQFLEPGENTVNFRLAAELYTSTVHAGHYDPDAWLQIYMDSLRTPGWHKDTYLEEYHRAFFDRLSQGVAPRKCAIEDIHIGGLAHVPALIAALDALGEHHVDDDVKAVREHVSLTHLGAAVDTCAQSLTRIIHETTSPVTLRKAIALHAAPWVGQTHLGALSRHKDRDIVGRHLSPACYLPESYVGSIALAWKHADDFEAGILANARCGGDSCHRGAIVGALLAAANDIPGQWLTELKSMEHLRNDGLAATT